MRTSPRNIATALLASTPDAELHAVLESLHLLTDVLGDAGLRHALMQPGRSTDDSERVLETCAKAAALPPSLVGLLRYLIHSGALPALPRVTRAFDRLAAARGVHRLIVTTAAPLSADTQKHSAAALMQAASALVGGTISLSWAVEPTLLGGARLQLDEDLLDQSFTTRLDALEALAVSSPTRA